MQNQAATVMVAAGRVAAAARVDASYSPCGASVTHLINSCLGPRESPLNYISIGSTAFAGFTGMPSTHTHTHTIHNQTTPLDHICTIHAMRPKSEVGFRLLRAVLRSKRGITALLT